MQRRGAVASIEQGAHGRFENPRLASLLLQLNARQVEFAHALVATYLTEHFTPAVALMRSILETSSLLCWASIGSGTSGQQARLIRCLLDFYRVAKAEGAALPDDATELVKHTTGKAAKKPPSFDDRLKQLDAHERKQEGGIPHWESHGRAYGFASRFVHATSHGPLTNDREPLANLGFTALRHGHQYFCLGAVAITFLADCSELRRRIEGAYARIHPVQAAEAGRLNREA